MVDEVAKSFLNRGIILTILHNLLRENVWIRNLPAILETMADDGQRVQNPELLTDIVRQRLARQIVAPYQDKNKTIFAAVIICRSNTMSVVTLRSTSAGRPCAGDIHPHDPAAARGSRTGV